MTDPDYRGFRRGPDGEWLFDGWAVFGHILPRLAVVMFPCHRDGETVDALGDVLTMAAFKRRGLVIEWLGAGVCFAFGRVYPR